MTAVAFQFESGAQSYQARLKSGIIALLFLAIVTGSFLSAPNDAFARSECKVLPTDKVAGSMVCVVIEPEMTWDRVLYLMAAPVIAIAALALNFSQNYKDRKRSIDDEFWLRTVAWEVAIEPLIQEFNLLREMLPELNRDVAIRSERVRLFLQTEFPRERDKITSAVDRLGMINASLKKTCLDEVRDLEDRICNFYAAAVGTPDKYHTNQNARDEVEFSMFRILSKIRELQTKK